MYNAYGFQTHTVYRSTPQPIITNGKFSASEYIEGDCSAIHMVFRIPLTAEKPHPPSLKHPLIIARNIKQWQEKYREEAIYEVEIVVHGSAHITFMMKELKESSYKRYSKDFDRGVDKLFSIKK